MEVLPATWLDTTVRAAFGFARAHATEAAAATATATTLAKGVLYAMTISKLKIMGAMVLACGFACGGVQTFGQLGRPSERPRQGGAVPDADEPQAALTRSVDKLQSELDETARRTTGMQKVLQDIRTDLKALRANRLAGRPMTEYAQAAGRLADALKRHPARLGADVGWGYQVYMLDLVEGGTTLVADEPLPGQFCSGIPRWSHDGTRIVFDTTGGEWPRARLMAIEVRENRPIFTKLGAGNNPTFSPDDTQIAFLLHAGNEAGAGGGVWMMRADGSGRHHVADFGAPFWSPDGRELLINSYTLPTKSTVHNLETKHEAVVRVAGHQIFSWPSWAGPGMVVSALAPAEKYEGDSIVLLDVRKPAEAKITEVLWKRSEDLNVTPRWPIYQPDTGDCFFVGEEPSKRRLYSLRRGESLRARQMGVVEHQRPGQHQQLAGLSFSPDGRYLLFEANRPERN